jgi:hypothetical protein
MVTEIELHETAGLTTLGSRLWGQTKRKAYKRNVDAQDELLAPILDSASYIKKTVKIISDEKQAIFAHEWHSALMLKVGYSNIYTGP